MFKALPMAIMVAGTAANKEKLKDLFTGVQGVATQSEVNDITKFIVVDAIDGTSLPDPAAFSDYLRKNMRSPNSSGSARDLALDQWGTAYKLEIIGGTVKVSSAGADKAFNTTDDVYSIRQL